MLLFWQVAPGPPQILLVPQVVLSVQSAVVWQGNPSTLGLQTPPRHLSDRQWLSWLQAVPVQAFPQTPLTQFWLWHWPFVEQGVGFPKGMTQVPFRHLPVLHWAFVVQVPPPGGHSGQVPPHTPVHGDADAAGASAVCSTGTVQAAPVRTAPRRISSRRDSPCCRAAGADVSGRPGPGVS